MDLETYIFYTLTQVFQLQVTRLNRQYNDCETRFLTNHSLIKLQLEPTI